MKKYLSFIVVFFSIIMPLCNAQSDFPKLKKGIIPELKILRETFYDGNSLWGYIDGGADLYLEYGFKKLLNQEVELNGAHYKVDIYNMSDAESAFGIFSNLAFKCERCDSVYQQSCITKYQYQAAVGAYYISIINDKGTGNSGRDSELLMKNIIADSKEFSLPLIYRCEIIKAQIKDVKFYKGILGIQNGLSEWEKMFENINFNFFYNLNYETEKGVIKIAQIKFSNQAEADKFIMRHKLDFSEATKNANVIRNDKYFSAWKVAGNTILFTESGIENKEADGLIKKLDEFIKANY